MNQTIAGCNNHSRGNVRVLYSDVVWYLARSLTNEFQITQSGVVGYPVGNELRLLQTMSVFAYFLGKFNHVI